MDVCGGCGFGDHSVAIDQVAARLNARAHSIAQQLVAHPAEASVRPSAERWSNLEYAAHIRDVLITIRDRLVIGLVEDDATFKPMYRDERIELGLYVDDTADDLARELPAAAAMLGRLFDAIDPAALDRMVQYGHPGPVPRSLAWLGRQAVHETEHHGTDIDENLAALQP